MPLKLRTAILGPLVDARAIDSRSGRHPCLAVELGRKKQGFGHRRNTNGLLKEVRLSATSGFAPAIDAKPQPSRYFGASRLTIWSATLRRSGPTMSGVSASGYSAIPGRATKAAAQPARMAPSTSHACVATSRSWDRATWSSVATSWYTSAAGLNFRTASTFHGELDANTPATLVHALQQQATAAGKANFEFHYFEGLEHGVGTMQYFT